MERNDIINAYVRIRKIDHTIPDEVLDFMKNSALEKLAAAQPCNCEKPWSVSGSCIICGQPISIF